MVNLLDVIEKHWSEGEHRERLGHYASDAVACRRQLYWKWTNEGVTNPVGDTGYWRMNIGNSIHALIQSTLEKIAADPERAKAVAWDGFAIDCEVRSGDVFVDGSDRFAGRKLSKPMRYRVDMVFTDDEGKICGGEIKTKYGAGVRAMKTEGLDASALVQGAIYEVMGMIERFYFPIVSRDDGDRVQFVLDLEGGAPDGKFVLSRVFEGGEVQVVKRYPFELFTKAIDRLADVEAALESGELPARDFRVAIKNGEVKKDFQAKKIRYKSDWQCMYCPFQARCWSSVCEEYQSGSNTDWFDAAPSDDSTVGSEVAEIASKAVEVYDPNDDREAL